MADITTGLPQLTDTPAQSEYARQMAETGKFLMRLPVDAVRTVVGAPGYGMGAGNPTAPNYVPPPGPAAPPSPAANAVETAGLLARYPAPVAPAVTGPAVVPKLRTARTGKAGAPAPAAASSDQADYLDNSAAYPDLFGATIGGGGPRLYGNDGSVTEGGNAQTVFNDLGQRAATAQAAVPAAAAVTGATPQVIRGLPSGGGVGGGFFDGLPDGGKMVNGKFASPRDALMVGYRMQQAARDSDMAAFSAAAGDGGQLGFGARASGLSKAFGANNFAGVGVGGINALNQSIAGVTSAGIGAGAQMYGSDAALTGRMAEVQQQQYTTETTPVQTGTALTTDPLTGLKVPTPTYSMRPTTRGGMPTPITAQPQTQQRVPGRTYKDSKGNQAVYNTDGTYTPVK